MRRRGFLQQLIGSAALAAAGSLPYAVARLQAPAQGVPERNYLRPPGALQDTARFNAACIGCGLCGEVCPPRCILFHSREGGDAFNTPYIDPARKACILCNKCMEVCPTAALTETPREEIDMGIAQIDRSACYPWVDRGICGACVGICPLGERAIGFKKWGQYQPYVKDGCVGCGLCVEVCPHPSKPIWIVERSRGTVVQHPL
ncbi:4Fe-4S dicluster domain-containing protein [Thiohalobacter sp. IOR34]|uniref:4Fe-4S dicluster domain-containing protein n=1 Tax=Thiohalobacter sp. IOR34 TaxID=3057176 RepID=UPI0025B0DCA2|nr:4Fe-4S dicluster domain-containing protein [Thiohalobacter sp. IOR34]WJW74803.1 4Fe-4S dicluster domain-containing protein [Thiohalobacter sp. IOR34]